MRFLILSDLHANWPALESALADAEGEYEQIVCCGDLVGYNPQPARVLDWTREHCAAVIRGNHDKVVAGIEDLDWFNDVAQAAARWTVEQLDDDQLTYLRELPPGPIQYESLQLWHGSPRDEDEYLTNAREAAEVFAYLDSPIGFFGHTHMQGGFFSSHRRVGNIGQVPKGETEVSIELDPDGLYMVNSGSVGQPRDGDARAAYALFDGEQKLLRLRRVEYPIKETAAEIRKAGLPDMLAERLSYGF